MEHIATMEGGRAMLKKIFTCLLIVIMLMGLCTEAVGAKKIPAEKAMYYCTSCGHFLMKKPCSFCGARSAVKNASNYRIGKTIQVLAGRSGPGTEYTSLGTYRVRGEYVRIINKSYDVNNVCWLQTEVRYGSKIRRIYTGLKRFNQKTFKINKIPTEKPKYRRMTIIRNSNVYYGPGSNYGIYTGLQIEMGEEVLLIQTENGFTQIEQENQGTPRRVWVPSSVLR